MVPRGTQKSRPCSARHPFSFACNAGPMQIPISRQKGFPFIGVRHRDRGGTQRAASSTRGRPVRQTAMTFVPSPYVAGDRRETPSPCAPASALVSASIVQAGAASPGSHAWIGNRLSGFCARQGSRRASPGRRGLPLPFRLSGYSIVAPSYFGNNAEVAALTLCRSRPVHEVPPRTQSCAKRSA